MRVHEHRIAFSVLTKESSISIPTCTYISLDLSTKTTVRLVLGTSYWKNSVFAMKL